MVRYMSLSLREKTLLYALSLSSAILCILIPIMRGYVDVHDAFMLLPTVNMYFPKSVRLVNYMMLAIIVALVPHAIIVLINDAYLDEIKRNAPIVLREIAEGLRSGMTMTQAVERVSLRRKDPISDMLRRASLLMSLGVSFDEAIGRAIRKYKAPLLQKIATTLKLAYMSGGKAVEVLETAASVYDALWAYERERRASIREYVLIVYISIVVMVLVSFMIINFFLESFAETVARSAVPGVPIPSGFLVLNVYDCLLRIAGVLEALFGGLIAGKMSRNKIDSGIPHILFLLLIAFTEWNLLGYMSSAIKGFLGG